MSGLTELLEQPEFRSGLLFGAIALAVGLVVAVWWRARRGIPAPVAGLLLTAAAVAGLERQDLLPAGLTLGLVALAGAGLVGEGAPVLLRAALLLPGAALVAYRGGLVDETWIRGGVAAAIPVAAILVADFDSRHGRRGLPAGLLAISAAGVYATVPDTEQAMVVLGAAVPVAVLTWPWAGARLGRAGAYAAAGLFLWAVAAGGFGRDSSIVGGAASLALLVTEPLGRTVSSRRYGAIDRLPDRWWVTPLVGALHAGMVFVAARVAGLRPSLAGAVVLAGGMLVVAAVVGAGLSGDEPVP